jgi:hypothetical protein
LEPRLVPLNAVIALLRGAGGWPKPFDGDGLDLRMLEVPVTTTEGLVTVDLLAYSAKLDLLVPMEVKGGANVDEDQARKYAAMKTIDVLRVATVQGAGAKSTGVEPMYVLLAEHLARARLGLAKADLDCPVLSVGNSSAELIASSQHRLSPCSVSLTSPPPGVVPLDGESPTKRYVELALPEIIARATSGEGSFSLDSVLEKINPYWGVTHDNVRGAVKTRAREALRTAFREEFRDNFALDTTSSGHAIIHVLATPADNDPRGQAQGWQAMQRKAERALARRPRTRVMPGQTSFEDLSQEAEAGER